MSSVTLNDSSTICPAKDSRAAAGLPLAKGSKVRITRKDGESGMFTIKSDEKLPGAQYQATVVEGNALHQLLDGCSSSNPMVVEFEEVDG